MSRLVVVATLLAALVAVAARQARAEQIDRALRLRVNPSEYERGPASIEEKVARRMRELDYKFRLICRGCLSPAAEADLLRLPDPNARLVPAEEPPAPPDITAPTSAATAPP